MDVESDIEEVDVEFTKEPLVFENDSYASVTLDRFNTLRKAGQFCDVKMQVNGNSIDAHKILLASSSAYFLELFSNDEQNVQQYYKLNNVDNRSFSVLLDYIYTGRLEVPREFVKAVYRSAILLKMPVVSEACSKYLSENLNLENCLGVREFANSNNDVDLADETDSFIQSNIEDVKESPHSKTLPLIQIDILGINEMSESTSEYICKLLISWAEESLNEASIDDLTLYLHKLYLGNDNVLHGCEEVEDVGNFSSSDEIQDYKKLTKRRLKKKEFTKRAKKGGHDAPVNNPYGDGVMSEEIENKVIGCQILHDRCCVCIAMLQNMMVKFSINVHEIPTNGHAHSNGSLTPPSPNGITLDKGNSLIALAKMSSPRCSSGIAVLSGKIIVFGGYDRSECLESVETFNIATNEWTDLPPMIVKRGRFDVCELDGCLYACGGSSGSHELKSVEFYNPVNKKWLQIRDMLSYRSCLGVTSINGKIYAVGGSGGDKIYTSCECYDQELKKWNQIANLNEGRMHCGVTNFQGQIIVVGGCDQWNSTNTVEVYDAEVDKWQFIASMNSPRRGAGVIKFDDKLYVIGGSDGQSALSSIEIYDPVTQSWTFGPNMKMPRANVGVVVVDNKLFAVGGFNGKKFLDCLEFLSIGSDDWCNTLPV